MNNHHLSENGSMINDALPTHFSFRIHVPCGIMVKRKIRSFAVQTGIYGEVCRVICKSSLLLETSSCSFIKVICSSRSMRRIKLFLQLLYNDCFITTFPVEFCDEHIFETNVHHKFSISKRIYLDGSSSLTLQTISSKPLLYNIYNDETWNNIKEKFNVRDSSWEWVNRYISKVEKLGNLVPEQSSSSEDLSEESKEFQIIFKKQKELARRYLKPPRLQRSSGVLTINDFQLEKSNPRGWTKDQIRIVLLDKRIGIGLEEEDITEPYLRGFMFETVVDSLLSVNGDKDGKMEHSIAKLLHYQPMAWIREGTVRWVYNTLLEYK